MARLKNQARIELMASLRLIRNAHKLPPLLGFMPLILVRWHDGKKRKGLEGGSEAVQIV